MALVTPYQIISAGIAGGLWGWAALAGAALMTSAVILAFIYVLGVLFRNAGLMANAKAELYEVVVTAIMIVFIYLGIGAMKDLTIGSFLPTAMIPGADPDSFGLDPRVSHAVSPDTNVYDVAAKYYLQVDRDMSGWLELNYILNAYVDQIASITPYARPLGVGLVASPMAGVAAPIKQVIYNMSVALALAFIINYAQLVVYVFSIKAFLNYYLPLGILLRSFTPTRRIGGTLIGVALTFLFIFPALSCLSYSIFYNPSSGPLLSFRTMAFDYIRDADFQKSFTSIMNPTDTTSTGTSSQQLVGGGMFDLISGALGGIGTMLEKLLGTVLLGLLLLPASIVAWAFVIGFVLPAINIMVLIQAAKVLSKSFGDEVDISSLTRLI